MEIKPGHPNFTIETDINPQEQLARSGFCWKPQIDHLQDAIQNGKLAVPTGGKIIIQYPESWRDSIVWTIDEIEPSHMPQGYVRLYDASNMHYGSTNFIDGPERGLVFKIPDDSRRWLPIEDMPVRNRKKHRKVKNKKFHDENDLIEDTLDDSEEQYDDVLL